jgi:DNA-binding NtrC family response regulator
MQNLAILVVDDEEAMRVSMAAWLEKNGHHVEMAASGEEALAILEHKPCDLVLLDIKMPGMDGHELLRQVKTRHPTIIIVMVTAYGTIESAVTALKEGASDYLRKPFDPRDLILLIRKLAEEKAARDEYHLLCERLSAFEDKGLDNLIGASAVIQALFRQIHEVAPAAVPVLITGETGTGKELVARAIHSRSERRRGPFVAINCGAVPEQLLESELFGHEQGAFTGAVKTRLGRLEMADQGTLFLDEVGEISIHMQVSLLRALEEKCFLRVGGSREVHSDFRLICATHRDIPALVEAGTVRNDFYYRINVISIHVPPLREREDDIILLAHHFIRRFSREIGKSIHTLTPAAYRLLIRHTWPGNVRELMNVIERAVVVCHDTTIDTDHLTFLSPKVEELAAGMTLAEMECRLIRQTLKETKGNISRSASILGINRGTLARRIKKHGIVTS